MKGEGQVSKHTSWNVFSIVTVAHTLTSNETLPSLLVVGDSRLFISWT